MNITPTNFIQLPLYGTADQLEIRVNSFHLFPSEISVFWKVTGIDSDVSKEGTIIIPQSIIDQWGTDDTIIKNYVLEQLNLTEQPALEQN